MVNEYIENDNIIYKAEALISIIYKDENSKRANIRNIIEDFDFKISSDKIRNNMNYNTKIDVVKNNFIVIDDNKVNLNLDIRFNIDIMIQDEINLIDKIEEEKDNKCYYSFCIYYAKKKDSLWDIAKKFRSTVNEIIKMNNLNEEEEIIEGQQLFITR